MAIDSSKILRAYFERDLSFFTELESKVHSEDDSVHSIHALRLYVEMDALPDGYKYYEETRREVRTALNSPPEDIVLYVLLLGIEILFLLNHSQREEAGLLLNRLKLQSSAKIETDLKAFIYHIQWKYYFFAGNYKQQLKALEEGLALLDEPGTAPWRLLKTDRVEVALVNDDLELASSDLDELKPFRHLTPFQGLGPYELMEAWYLDRAGQFSEALKMLDEIPEKSKKLIWGIYVRTKIIGLLKEERFDEAGRLLAEAEPTRLDECPATIFSRRFFTRFNYQSLRAHEALFKGEFDRAFALAQNLTSSPTAYGKPPAQWLLFHIEMARKQTRAARLIVQSIDPQCKNRLAEWARLHLSEGNYDQAVELFKKVCQTRGEGYLKNHLAHARELSPKLISEILVRLWKTSKVSAPIPDRSEPKTATPLHTFLIGKSPSIQEIKSQIEKFAPLHATVLISGETGSGKDVVARLIHDMSPFAKEPFIAINCGAMSDTLIESELFGYEKGAFTGAQTSHSGLFISAGKGTLFLDEISSMSTHLQSALLRVLEDEQVRPIGSNKSFKVEARIIAATNEPLEDMVQQKRFRKDLFYRLARLHIAIPPLRERTEDIPLLADYFLRKLFGNLDYEISNDLLERLKQQDWPGNVRQLKNMIERFAYHSGNSGILNAELFDQELRAETLKPEREFSSTATASAFAPSSLNRSQLFVNPYRGDYQGNRLNQILALLQERKQITRLEIIREVQCSPNTATHDLRQLESKGLIKRIQTTNHAKSSYFVLADAPPSAPSI